jgi:surface antigen
LEEYVSGQSASWHNPESGNRGEITPIRTFKSPEGTWCREYSTQETRGALQETRQAIACREGNGRWQTRVLILQDS